MAVPKLMVWLSATLPAKTNRIANITVAAIYLPISRTTAADESWRYFFGLAVALQMSVLAVIIQTALSWPGALAASNFDRDSA